MSSSDESDIRLPPVVAKKQLKAQPSPMANTLKNEDHKRVPTKVMVNQALIDLKTRKGVSVHAIKKYIEERYEDRPERINFYIKKYLKSAVEKGEIVQVKGVGASGSFRLVPTKPKVEKKKATKPQEKKPKSKKKEEHSEKAPAKKVTKKTKEHQDAKDKEKKVKKKKTPKEVGKGGIEEAVVKKKLIKPIKIGKVTKTSTPMKKKGSMMKRKSIGSVIKKPKMKPKARA